MAKQVRARDTISGKISLVPEIYLELPGFKEHLVLVDEGAKDYVPGMFRPDTTKDNAPRKRKHEKMNDPEERKAGSDTTSDSDLQ